MFPLFAPRVLVQDRAQYRLEPCREHHRQSLFSMVESRYTDVGCKFDLNSEERDLRDFEECWQDAGGEFMVLTHQGNVIGSLAIRPIEDRHYSAMIDWFFFRREYEGKGLSLLLFKWCMNWCAQHHIRFLELWSNENRKSAHRLYRQLGFVHNGITRPHQTNPNLHFLYFELEITPHLEKRFEKFLSKI
jgi:GNAT superfamily N-acetyltransferase